MFDAPEQLTTLATFVIYRMGALAAGGPVLLSASSMATGWHPRSL